MEKLLNKHFKAIHRYILPEGLEKVEQAFTRYGNDKHDQTLRNNKKIVKLFTTSLQEEFLRLRTSGENRDEKKNKKQIFNTK